MQKILTALANPEIPLPYESIDTGLSESDVRSVMDNFMEFLHLPYSERVKIVHVDETRPRTGGAGYSYKGERSPDGSSLQDNKHVFHMTQSLDVAFQTQVWQPSFAGAARRFLKEAADVHYALADAGKAKYQELEDEIPGITGIHFPRTGKLAHHTRFLAYQGSKEGMLATPHYDKSTGTIAVAESHGGLRMGFGPNDLTAVDRKQFQPIFFPGYGYHQLAQILDVTPTHRAAWHDVVDTGELVNEEITRLALINFINPANIYLESTQEQTHTPIPWRGLGQLALRSDNQSFLAA